MSPYFERGTAAMIEEYYTYSDYYEMNEEDERWELIDGMLYDMTPAPILRHQRVLSRLHIKLGNYLEGSPCDIFPAPFDVRLNADTYDDTVVQPDISIICNNDILDDKGCVGAPDIVVEILSPSTAIKDKTVKLKKYMESGVKEYWIVDPIANTVQVYKPETGLKSHLRYESSDTIETTILPGLKISLKEIFAD
jgi:Uma2 family endonuclease